MGLAIKMCCGERCFCRSPRRPCGRQAARLMLAPSLLRKPETGIPTSEPVQATTEYMPPSPWDDI
jgi:hypothetical protein